MANAGTGKVSPATNIQESETPGIAWNTELVFALVDYVTPAP